MFQRTISILALSLLFSCSTQTIDTSAIDKSRFTEFRNKTKFVKELASPYPGIADPALRPLLTQKINQAATDFEEVSAKHNPTTADYQAKVGQGLHRFDATYLQLDTEDRERVCAYFEELMDIVGLESSDGQLNQFMYGFDPQSAR